MKIRGKFNPRRSANAEIARQPVRGESYRRDNIGFWWQPFAREQGKQIFQSAKEYERRTKTKGKSSGALGHTGLEVLKALIEIIDWKTGRLEPSLAYIARRINRCTKTIVSALQRLRKHGFLDWKRRYEATGEKIEFGRPQVRQISNAYRLLLPMLKNTLSKFLGRPVKHLPDSLVANIYAPCPIPEDVEAHERNKVEIHMEYMRQVKVEKSSGYKTPSDFFDLDKLLKSFSPDKPRTKEEQMAHFRSILDADFKNI
jgi:hypothetical protein